MSFAPRTPRGHRPLDSMLFLRWRLVPGAAARPEKQALPPTVDALVRAADERVVAMATVLAVPRDRLAAETVGATPIRAAMPRIRAAETPVPGPAAEIADANFWGYFVLQCVIQRCETE